MTELANGAGYIGVIGVALGLVKMALTQQSRYLTAQYESHKEERKRILEAYHEERTEILSSHRKEREAILDSQAQQHRRTDELLSKLADTIREVSTK